MLWFWPVNKMIELVCGMPTPQVEDESSWVRGSDLVQGSSGSCVSSLIDVRCFRMLPGVGVPQAEVHWYGQLKINWRFGETHRPRLQGKT
jgi:hypothetical protein